MSNHLSQSDSVRPSRRKNRRELLRYPPLFWRRIAVGVTLALPGTIAGLMIAILSPAWAATYLAVAGTIIGFFGGYCMENC